MEKPNWQLARQVFSSQILYQYLEITCLWVVFLYEDLEELVTAMISDFDSDDVTFSWKYERSDCNSIVRLLTKNLKLTFASKTVISIKKQA